ncbi:membrane protein [Enterococcus faecium]|nr:membrane protein [Enterococcus faecium]
MFETIKQNIQKYALLRAAVYIISGIAIVLNPSAVFHFIGYLITAYLVLLGLLNLFEAYRFKRKTGSWSIGLFSGLFFLILALIVYAFAPAITTILPILLGLAVIINSLFQLFFSMNTKAKSWSVYSSILLLIGGFVLLFNPFKSLMLLFQIFGFILIFMGIQEIINFIRIRKMTINISDLVCSLLCLGSSSRLFLAG